MKKMDVLKASLCWLVLLLSCVTAGADEKSDYLKLAQQVREEVWNDTPADFKKREVPEKYKNESAVILSYYREVSTDYSRKATSELLLNFRLTRQIDCSDMERMLIQINDKKALKDYSEFSFRTKTKKWFAGYQTKTKTIVGIRVLKKNGSVQVVSLDDYVDVKEGAKDKDLSQKIAVPNLEIGDCLDVFTYDQIGTQEQQLDPFMFFLRQDEPMLYGKVHCVLDQSLATVYRSMNGAPDFTQTTDKNKNVVLDLTVNQPVDAEPSVWYNSSLQSPCILMYVTPTKSKTIVIEKAMRQKGVRANPDVEPILQDDWKLMGMSIKKGGYSPLSVMDFKEVRNLYKDLKEASLSAEEKADRLYSILYVDSRTDQRNLNTLANYVRKLGYDVEMGITTPLGAPSIDQVINYNENAWFFRLKDTGKYYFMGTYPKVASEMPYQFQGRKAYMQDGKTLITLPESKAEDNKSVVSIKAQLTGTTLNINRKVDYSGEQKLFGQSVCASATSYFGPEHLTAYWQYLKYDEEGPYAIFSKKNQANLKSRYDEYLAKERPEQFKAEVTDFHDSEPTKMGDFGIDCVGIRKDSADLIYHVSYDMDGLVKRAGRNLLVSVGKLIGQQKKLEGNDRVRKDDIWRKFAYVDEFNVELALPAGYKVSTESLNKLTSSVSNECGEFTVTAKAEGDKVQIQVRKSFLHRLEPAANWDKVLKLVDASSAFTDKEIVIMK